MSGNTFYSLYSLQKTFQEIVEKEMPHDDPKRFNYHMTAMIEELGEVLKTDKRWKTHRNDTFNQEEKIDEIADCYITLMNISMWSGLSSDEVLDAISHKITQNYKRLK